MVINKRILVGYSYEQNKIFVWEPNFFENVILAKGRIYNHSWRRDGIFRDPESWSGSFRDRDLFWAKSKNPENPEIPGIGIGISKLIKNPEIWTSL